MAGRIVSFQGEVLSIAITSRDVRGDPPACYFHLHVTTATTATAASSIVTTSPSSTCSSSYTVLRRFTHFANLAVCRRLIDVGLAHHYCFLHSPLTFTPLNLFSLGTAMCEQYHTRRLAVQQLEEQQQQQSLHTTSSTTAPSSSSWLAPVAELQTM